MVWDATGTRRLQQKIDAIDKAGRELVRLEGDAMSKMNVGQRLKLLEDKIISFTRDLMHFDHFAIRLLDRKANKLELVISLGLPQRRGEHRAVRRTRRQRHQRIRRRDRAELYLPGCRARSALCDGPGSGQELADRAAAIARQGDRHLQHREPQRAAFNEDDRQFAEIFGRYVAIALNILDLMVVERTGVAHKVADDVSSEVAGPLNDIVSDASALMDDYIGHDDLRGGFSRSSTTWARFAKA